MPPKKERKCKLQHEFMPEKIMLLDGTTVKPPSKAKPSEVAAPPPLAESTLPPTAKQHKRNTVKTVIGVKQKSAASPISQKSGGAFSSREAPPNEPKVHGPAAQGPACLLWFHTQDMRVRDNPAVLAASKFGGPVIPVFVWAPHEEGELSIGGAAKLFILECLKALSQTLIQKYGINLVLRKVPKVLYVVLCCAVLCCMLCSVSCAVFCCVVMYFVPCHAVLCAVLCVSCFVVVV